MDSCEKCGHTTQNRGDMKKHMRAVHDKLKLYACEVCGGRFTTCSDLRRHERTHQSVKPFICSFENCGFATSRREHLVNHESTHTGIESRLTHLCVKCGKYFSSRSVLNRHSKNCSASKKEGESLKCSECVRTFSSASKLKQHSKQHEGEQDFDCELCDKKFSTRHSLTKHRSLHGQKKFACHLCSKPFSRKDYLLKHLQVHGKGGGFEYLCNLCHRAFHTTAELEKHSSSCGLDGKELIFIPNYSHEVIIHQVDALVEEEEEVVAEDVAQPQEVEQEKVYYIII